MTRLSDATLSQAAVKAAVPAYARQRHGIGVVHLGNGAFHRAHQGVYFDDLLAGQGGDWAIASVSLRQPDVRDRMVPQDGLYTVIERETAGEGYQVVGAIRACLFAPEERDGLLARLAAPETKLVTLTITEKGYCRDAASGALLEDDPDIRHDLEQPRAPKTALGFLAEGLARRRADGIAPFTVLSCDNLPHNGASLQAVLSAFCALRDDGLAAWVEREAAFPSSMVDRIVPATTDEDRDALEAVAGYRDEAAVVCEPFRQWVIEDRFCNDRPALERVGAELVSDVAPFEAMKLRLLNGPHSALAYLGYLSGCEYVSDCLDRPELARFSTHLMAEEIKPTVTLPDGYDLDGYIGALLARFSNAPLKHRTWQIAMDGSQKLPQRLLGTIRDRLAAGQPITYLSYAVAAWMYYVSGIDAEGHSIDVRDPLAARLQACTADCRGHASSMVHALARVNEVFGADLERDPRFTGMVTDALAALYRLGPRGAIKELVA